jgi:hypothetical protein
MSKAKTERVPRWASRQQAMQHAKCGSTKMNQWLKGGKLRARKDGARIIIDLNDLDDLIASLPSAATAAE